LSWWNRGAVLPFCTPVLSPARSTTPCGVARGGRLRFAAVKTAGSTPRRPVESARSTADGLRLLESKPVRKPAPSNSGQSSRREIRYSRFTAASTKGALSGIKAGKMEPEAFCAWSEKAREKKWSVIKEISPWRNIKSG